MPSFTPWRGCTAATSQPAGRKGKRLPVRRPVRMRPRLPGLERAATAEQIKRIAMDRLASWFAAPSKEQEGE